jgi:ADP-ribosylglycohydrolase
VQLATEAELSERDRLRNLYDFIGSTLAAADAVPCAFGILALAEGNPIYAAIYAAALSGDADTVGAMACAIAGAWQGIDAIPLDHIETLRRVNSRYNFEEIAEDLYEIAMLNHQAMPPPSASDSLLDDILNQVDDD